MTTNFKLKKNQESFMYKLKDGEFSDAIILTNMGDDEFLLYAHNGKFKTDRECYLLDNPRTYPNTYLETSPLTPYMEKCKENEFIIKVSDDQFGEVIFGKATIPENATDVIRYECRAPYDDETYGEFLYYIMDGKIHECREYIKITIY